MKEVNQKQVSLKSYFISLLCLFLSCAMFMGTTFAWFSEDVVSAGNEITIGSLRVALLHHEGDTQVAVDENHQVFDKNVKWKPDHVEVEVLTVQNLGDIAFDYRLQFVLDQAGCVLTDGMTAQKVAKWFDVYCYDGDATKATDDMTDPNWKKVDTLDKLLDEEASILKGALENQDDKDTVAIGLYLRSDATGEIMGQRLSVQVKLTADQQGIAEEEPQNQTVTVTQESLSDPDFFKGKDNTVFRFSGSFDSLTITPDTTLNQVFDGSNATVSGTVTVNAPGVPHAYDNLKDAQRQGSVTVKGFTATTLNVLAYNNEQLTIERNTVNAMSVIGGNFALNILNNTIDGKFASYTDGENVANKYGISLRICDYELAVTGNTITDTASHAIGLNGRQNESGKVWGGKAQITAFNGNTIAVNTTAETGRAAFKTWDDITYDPLNTASPNEAAKALINMILEGNDLTVGDGHYAVCIDAFKTSTAQ